MSDGMKYPHHRRAEANTDPRNAGGDMVDIGTSRTRYTVQFDLTRAVLLDYTEVALVEPYSAGQSGGPVLAVNLHGRINKTKERVHILYLMNEDGAAAIISELIALGYRIGKPFGERLMERVRRLVDEGHTRPASDEGGPLDS